MAVAFGGCIVLLAVSDEAEQAAASDDHMAVCKRACDVIADCEKSGELPPKGGDIEANRAQCKKSCPTDPSEQHRKMYRELAPCLDKSCSDMVVCTLEVSVRHQFK